MPDALTVLITIGATLVILGLVLTNDFFFRQDVYDRSDPVSFALFLYSFLLAFSETGLSFASLLTAKPVNLVLPLVALGYLACVFTVFQFTKRAHKSFKIAQDNRIKAYLRAIRELSGQNTPDAVWRALEALGVNAIEPDVFVKNEKKLEKRVEFLEIVKELTQAPIDPRVAQAELLVNNKRARNIARIGYFTAFTFGLLSTLVFFLFRLV